MKKAHNLKFLLIFFLFISLVSIKVKADTLPTATVSDEVKTEIQTEINNLYNTRSSTFISGDLNTLPPLFDTSKKFGVWALEHEVKRVKYLRQWAYNRDITFTNVSSETQVKKITPSNGGFKVRADEYYKFQYIYNSDEDPITNTFGVGIIHSVELIRKDDKWVISTDWYTDCFEDALKAYSADINDNYLSEDTKINIGNCPKVPQDEVSKARYNRLKAVQYADKYCGIPWASGNNYKHNKKYKNYTGAGGDCTNFVSQCLGDKEEGGGFKFDGGWYCVYDKYNGGTGSKAWVNADAFKNYIIYSGRGTVIKKGTFKDLASSTENNPCGYTSKLELGDLVCYAKGSDIDHFGIVTAFDSHGYPLINSHTTDRYHVPWDLGWGDKNINFYLIHVK